MKETKKTTYIVYKLDGEGRSTVGPGIAKIKCENYTTAYNEAVGIVGNNFCCVKEITPNTKEYYKKKAKEVAEKFNISNKKAYKMVLMGWIK